MLKHMTMATVAAALVACDAGPVDPNNPNTPTGRTYPARYSGTIKVKETRGSGRDTTVSDWVFNAVFVLSNPSRNTVGDYDLQSLSLMGTQIVSVSGAAGTTETCTTSSPITTVTVGSLSVREPSNNQFTFGGTVSWIGDGTETCRTMTNTRMGFSASSAVPQAQPTSPCNSGVGTLAPVAGGTGTLAYREQLRCNDGAVPVDRTEDWSLTGM